MTLSTTCFAAKFVEVRPVDEEYLQVYVQDSTIKYNDTGTGPGAFMGHETRGPDQFVAFGTPLDTKKAQDVASYSITSSDDSDYSSAVHPSAVHRKTKVSGTTEKYPEPPYSLEHTLYLKLPNKMQQGKLYTLKIDPATNIDSTSHDVVFDVYSNVSEALHVNIIGYDSTQTVMKSADLYMWLGDGGQRDYSSYAGRKAVLYNVETNQKTDAGEVKFWKKSGADFGKWNLTASDVWNCDFSSFTGAGKYRLVIEGIGCSPDFVVEPDAYLESYKTSVRGFFYMRIGQPKDSAVPPPRQPRLIQGQDPPELKVYLTTMSPWSPDWKTLRGDGWDVTDWSKWKEPGDPTNPNAWGGHSDATDWDRNPNHISIIWDLLLPYFLSNGKVNEDNLGIPESGNSIPDLIDEARYEADFWLRIRDGNGGYSAGVNNPPGNHTTLYQAGAKPYMAWASAANCAMIADCMRIAGKTDLMNQYRDSALEAWKVANDQDLDLTVGIGNGATRGRDLRMLAAAFLYNVTGDTKYEDVMAQDSVAASGAGAQLDKKGEHCQYWGTAAYLMCAKMKWQPIHHPDLLKNMQQLVRAEAFAKNVAPTDQRPSRRSSNEDYGHFQSTEEVQLACIAHAFSDSQEDKDALLKALILEADWGLGRNPLNMVQMTMLGSRHADDIYTIGRNDGIPGVVPGQTPYMNAAAWGKGYMADPQWYASKGYPAWKDWPHGEALWHARYCYSNNEYTPQQTMRGKMVLLGYLYSLRK